MIKSRLCVVNEETYEKIKTSGVAMVRIPSNLDKKNNSKLAPKFPDSVNSLMADMLNICIGDYIFFWCEKSSDSKSRIYGIYKVVSNPYYHFDTDDDMFPFKFKIEEEYHFENPILEYDILNSPFSKDKMWNILGKKISGKPRGTIPITPEETSILITFLINKNPNFVKTGSSSIVQQPREEDEIVFNYNYGDKISTPNKITDYNINSYYHFKTNKKMRLEKSFEAMFNYEIRKQNKDFFKQLSIDIENIIWYGNYLPYSLDATEMDYLIFVGDKGFLTKAYVIEFKCGKLDISHFNRSLIYSKWVNDHIGYGNLITEPIIICEKSPSFDLDPESEVFKKIENEFEYNTKKVSVYEYEYDFTDNKSIFTKKK